MTESSDKRTSRRTPLGKALSFEVTVLEEGRPVTLVAAGIGVDLGGGGMGLVTHHPLKGGEVIKLLFPVAGAARLPVFTEVMWASRAGGEFRTGLRFLS